jgi:hypothetical protein
VGTAAAIVRHLKLPLEEAEIPDVVRNRVGAGALSREIDADTWWDGLDAEDAQTVKGALAPYLAFPARNEAVRISWAPELFLLGDRSHEPATGAIDITGRPRCLFNGPRIVLPSGSWSLTVAMLFSRDAAEHEFVAELFTDVQLASGTIRPSTEGRAEISLNFVVPELADQPVSLRVSTRRAAFDGVIALVGATLARPGGSANEAPPGTMLQSL